MHYFKPRDVDWVDMLHASGSIKAAFPAARGASILTFYNKLLPFSDPKHFGFLLQHKWNLNESGKFGNFSSKHKAHIVHLFQRTTTFTAKL